MIQTSQLIVGIGQVGIKGHGAKQSRLGVFIVFLLHVDGAQIDIDDAQVPLGLDRALEQGERSVGMVVFPFNVAQIRQGLSMAWVKSYFMLELLPCRVILLRFPVEIAKAKMNVGLAGRYFRRRLELGNRSEERRV